MKYEKIERQLSFVMLLVFSALPMSGCAANRHLKSTTRTVQENEQVAVSYTCTLADGSLAITNQQQVADDPAMTRSPLFRTPKEFGPQFMTATLKPMIDPTGHTKILGFKFKSFEEAVTEQLAGRLVGLPYDEVRQVRLSSTVPDGLEARDRYLKRYRKTRHPKVLRVPLWQVTEQLGKAPVAGAKWQGKDGITFIVDSVDGKVVHLRRQIKSGAKLQTPFGPAEVSDDGDSYTLNIDPKVGTVVRSGPLVGRISRVSDQSFQLDYGNPYGFEDLDCRVRIERPDGEAANGVASNPVVQ